MKKYPPGGFSLVEVTIALGVAAFCLVAVFGLLPVGLNSNQASIEQTAATNIMSMVVSDLRSTPKTETTSPRYAIRLTGPTTLYLKEDGSKGTIADSRYRLQAALTAPATDQRTATKGSILMSWPGKQDDPTKASGFVESFVALDRN